MKNYMSFKSWKRGAIGMVVAIGAGALTIGWETSIPAKFSIVNAAHAQEPSRRAVVRKRTSGPTVSTRESRALLGDEGDMPDPDGAVGWLNSVPLSRASLRGKVVLVDFWTYTCINSLRPLPYVKAWAAKYKDAGLFVIGVHTPEFSFEHEPANVEWAVRNYKVSYPVAIDSNAKIWNAFNNDYWPAQYLVDAKGRIRYHHRGEGDFGEIEHAIRELLKENGASGLSADLVTVSPAGIEAAGDSVNERLSRNLPWISRGSALQLARAST